MAEKKNDNLEQYGSNDPVEFVKLKYREAESATLTDIERFSRYYKLYRNKQVVRNYEGLANLFIPEPRRIVARKTAKIVNSIKRINALPQGPEDAPAAQTANILADFITRKLSLKNFYRSWIKDSRIVGLSWAKVTWDVTAETDKEPWKGFKIDMFSVDRVFMQPKKTLLDYFQGKVDWLIVEYEADIESLEKNKNFDKETLGLMKKSGGKSMAITALSQSRLLLQQSSDTGKTQVNSTFVIKEFWGKHEGKEMLIVVANDKWLLRHDDNPYEDVLDFPIPVVPMASSIEPHELFPIGDIEPNESLFNELNDTRNQRMDTVTLNIDPMKILVRSANIKKKDLVARRGWLIESDMPNGIQVIPPDMQGVVASINEERIIRSDIQQSSGVLDFAQDGGTAAGLNIDTARGTLIAKGEADAVTEDEIEVVKESLRMFWRIVLSYSQSFLDRGFVARIVENGVEKFYQIDKESIKGNIDVDIEIETLQDKTTRQSMAILLFNQAKTVPGATIGKFFSDMLLAFKDSIQIDEYYQQPQPAGPETPKISIALRGDLSPSEVDEIYKSIPNVDPQMADPMLREELRQLMRGELPEMKEDAQRRKTEAETAHIEAKTLEKVLGKEGMAETSV